MLPDDGGIADGRVILRRIHAYFLSLATEEAGARHFA